MGTTKVSLLQKMRVKVDGKKVTLPYIKLGVLSVMRDGYRVILRTNGGEWTLIYPARALRALGLLLADGAPTVGRGKTF